MKNIITTIFLVLIVFSTATAQMKKPKLNAKVNTKTVNVGAKIKNVENLSINELATKKIPLISITEKQRNAKTITSWKIVPNRPKDNWLKVKSFYGWLQSDKWMIESRPLFEGSRISRWNPGWLELSFKQSKGVEYRLKVKIQGSNHRSKSLYVNTGDTTGRYPINPDGTVHVIWISSASSSTRTISIGHLLPNNFSARDFIHGFPRTTIEYISIDKI